MRLYREVVQSILPGKHLNGEAYPRRESLSWFWFLGRLELTHMNNSEPVTEAQIISAERSLYRVRLDISQRTRSLALATSSAAREAAASATQSVLSMDL